MNTRQEVVIVSGATEGIGRHVTGLLAQSGYRVYAGLLGREALESWQENVIASVNIVPVSLDITQPRDIASLCETLDAGALPVRALVNVAGISHLDAYELMAPEKLRAMFEVNVLGTMALTGALLPYLKRSGGRIVTVTSMAGQVTTPLFGGYAATKAALESLHDALRLELRPYGVDVSIVEPGGVRTGMVEAAQRWVDDRARHCQETAGLEKYVEAYRAVSKSIRCSQASILAPEQVAILLASLVDTPEPRSRYLIGRDARILVTLKKLLPSSAMDWLLAKQMGLAVSSKKLPNLF